MKPILYATQEACLCIDLDMIKTNKKFNVKGINKKLKVTSGLGLHLWSLCKVSLSSTINYWGRKKHRQERMKPVLDRGRKKMRDNAMPWYYRSHSEEGHSLLANEPLHSVGDIKCMIVKANFYSERMQEWETQRLSVKHWCYVHDWGRTLEREI